MKKITGKVLISNPDKLKPEIVLEFEQWLNDQVAKAAFSKFGIGLRIHLEAEE